VFAEVGELGERRRIVRSDAGSSDGTHSQAEISKTPTRAFSRRFTLTGIPDYCNWANTAEAVTMPSNILNGIYCPSGAALKARLGGRSPISL
jgi:hypothetical protein